MEKVQPSSSSQVHFSLNEISEITEEPLDSPIVSIRRQFMEQLADIGELQVQHWLNIKQKLFNILKHEANCLLRIPQEVNDAILKVSYKI